MFNSLMILKHNNFKNYFLANLISWLGSGMTFIGLNWFILDVTGSSELVGLLMILSLLSRFIIFPFSGTVADSLSRKKILIWLNLFRGLFLILTSIIIIYDQTKISIIFILSIVNGIGMGIHLPTSNALIQELLNKDDLINANSILEVSIQVGCFTAAFFCGLIYKYFGFTPIILFDALTFFISIYFLLKIRYKSITLLKTKENFKKQFFTGISYLLNNKLILYFGILCLIPFIVTIASNVVLPSYVKNYLHAGSVVFGSADMAFGVGAFIAGLLVSNIVNKIKNTILIYFLYVISIISLWILTIINHYILLYILYFILGISNTYLKIILNTILMKIVPNIYFGRATSVWLAFSSLLQIFTIYTISKSIDIYPASFGYHILSFMMFLGIILLSTLLKKIKINI